MLDWSKIDLTKLNKQFKEVKDCAVYTIDSQPLFFCSNRVNSFLLFTNISMTLLETTSSQSGIVNPLVTNLSLKSTKEKKGDSIFVSLTDFTFAHYLNCLLSEQAIGSYLDELLPAVPTWQNLLFLAVPCITKAGKRVALTALCDLAENNSLESEFLHAYCLLVKLLFENEMMNKFSHLRNKQPELFSFLPVGFVFSDFVLATNYSGTDFKELVHQCVARIAPLESFSTKKIAVMAPKNVPALAKLDLVGTNFLKFLAISQKHLQKATASQHELSLKHFYSLNWAVLSALYKKFLRSGFFPLSDVVSSGRKNTTSKLFGEVFRLRTFFGFLAAAVFSSENSSEKLLALGKCYVESFTKKHFFVVFKRKEGVFSEEPVFVDNRVSLRWACAQVVSLSEDFFQILENVGDAVLGLAVALLLNCEEKRKTTLKRTYLALTSNKHLESVFDVFFEKRVSGGFSAKRKKADFVECLLGFLFHCAVAKEKKDCLSQCFELVKETVFAVKTETDFDEDQLQQLLFKNVELLRQKMDFSDSVLVVLKHDQKCTVTAGKTVLVSATAVNQTQNVCLLALQEVERQLGCTLLG